MSVQERNRMNRALSRRGLLAGATVLPCFMRPALAAPASLPQQPSVMVAGPAASALGRWAEVIAPALGQSMGGGDALGLEMVGGADGVTGVNQFQARVTPDGATALLLPGAALLAWLVGDSRVRFDAGSWATLWGASGTAVVASRGAIGPGKTVRLAVGSVVGPELQALLALHLMGVAVEPVAMTREDPLSRRDVDAVYVRGGLGRESLTRAGWIPQFCLGAGMSGPVAGLPMASSLFASSADPTIAAAFRAVSAAASLEAALVLPAVVPGTVLAWWRRGCDKLDETPAVGEMAAGVGVQPGDAGAIAGQMGSVKLDTTTLLALRTLLAERFHWQPG